MGATGRQVWDNSPQSLALLQVGQYVSRAEELKAIVSSSNKALLKQGTSARDLLRGGLKFLAYPPGPLQRASSLRGGRLR